jgi:hypothetical protein
MKYLFLALLPFSVLAQSSMDIHRWYLNPQGQETKISIDDLHDEIIEASPSMNWGRDVIPTLSLKKEITIAVIDGGIEIEHPELKNHIAYNSAECFEGTIIPPKDGEDKDKNGYKGDCAGWDFVTDSNRPEDLDGHGTHVTGVMNSVLNGIQGSYKFLPLKVFAPDEGRQNVKVATPLPIRLQKAFEYALSRNVDIIHMSVGWPKSFMSFELEQIIKKAIDNGVIIVAAAGNSSQRAAIFPCQMEGVICVGALRPNGEVARFSNWGGQVDVFAPGEKILSTIPFRLAPLHISRKGYDFKNGTSQAAPFISASMAALKGLSPDDSRDHLYARLMRGSDKGLNGSGLKGLFHLDRSIKLRPEAFVFPMTKGLNAVVNDGDVFTLNLPLKNYGELSASNIPVSIKCDEAQIENPETILDLNYSETKIIPFFGRFNKEANYLNCRIQAGKESVSIRLKVQSKLIAPFKKIIVKQDELLVANTRSGARSRFMTMNAIKGTEPQAYYYVSGEIGTTLYSEDKVLGNVSMPAGCSFLRVWQIDFDKNGTNELMTEGLCDKTHLLYQFLDLNLKELYPSVKYKPTLTIVNYDDFEVVTKQNEPPVFRFVNIGFLIPTATPWDSDVTGKANHLYELFPVKDGDNFRFDVRILENTQNWQKSLGLRYMPAYNVLHYVKGKLLVKVGIKTAWVNVADQTAVWANLDNVFLSGSRKQDLIGSGDYIFQSFLTPFEYRGFLLSGVKLRFIQDDNFDPLLDVLGTEVNSRGYKTVIRTFQRLVYLQYDFTGELIEKKDTVVDRFDFLTAQDLISSVVNLVHEGRMIQLVDGTKVNTNYVDLVIDGESKSFEIPSNCVTQQPVIVNGLPTLPVFCGKNKTEFEMRFIELKL